MELILDSRRSDGKIHRDLNNVDEKGFVGPRCKHNDWNIYTEINYEEGFPVFKMHYARTHYIERQTWPHDQHTHEEFCIFMKKYSEAEVWRCSLYCVGCGYVEERIRGKGWDTVKYNKLWMERFPKIIGYDNWKKNEDGKIKKK